MRRVRSFRDIQFQTYFEDERKINELLSIFKNQVEFDTSAYFADIYMRRKENGIYLRQIMDRRQVLRIDVQADRIRIKRKRWIVWKSEFIKHGLQERPLQYGKVIDRKWSRY